MILKHHANVTQLRGHMHRCAGHRATLQDDAASTHWLKACNGTQQRGLAAARRPQQTGNFTLIHAQVHPLHNRVGTISQ